MEVGHQQAARHAAGIGHASGAVQAVAGLPQVQQRAALALGVFPPGGREARGVSIGDDAVGDPGLGLEGDRLEPAAADGHENLGDRQSCGLLGLGHGRAQRLLGPVEIDHHAGLEAARWLQAIAQHGRILAAPEAAGPRVGRRHDQAHGLAGADVEHADGVAGPHRSSRSCLYAGWHGAPCLSSHGFRCALPGHPERVRRCWADAARRPACEWVPAGRCAWRRRDPTR
jgi:hypothetical protein